MDAFAVFGLPQSASETEIRARYLELVREHPPERAPERFAEIRAAYDELRDPATSLQRRLFRLHTDDTLERLKIDVQRRLAERRLPLEILASLAERS